MVDVEVETLDFSIGEIPGNSGRIHHALDYHCDIICLRHDEVQIVVLDALPAAHDNEMLVIVRVADQDCVWICMGALDAFVVIQPLFQAS